MLEMVSLSRRTQGQQGALSLERLPGRVGLGQWSEVVGGWLPAEDTGDRFVANAGSRAA